MNDFIPGKNQGTSTVPANAEAPERRLLRPAQAAEPGAVSDLRPADGAARSGEPEPVHPRSPFPNNIIPANRIVNPLYNLLQADGADAQPELRRERDDADRQLLPGRRAGHPGEHLFGGRVDYNPSGNDRFFFRGSGSTFLEGVSDWTYEVPAFDGPALDRPRRATPGRASATGRT